MLTDTRGSTNHRPPYPPAYPYKPGGPNPPPPAPRSRCCCCPGKLSASACTCLGVCVLVLGYTLLGAFTFMALEGGFSQQPPPKNTQTLSADMRSRTVERLWSITEDLNILYKDNWTRLAAQEVLKFQDTLVQSMRKPSGAPSGGQAHYNQQHRWSFASSFLYSLTLITTIGRSCTTLLTKVIDNWQYALEDTKSRQVDAVMLDWSKAFDQIPQTKLHNKLSNYGISDSLHRWKIFSRAVFKKLSSREKYQTWLISLIRSSSGVSSWTIALQYI